MGQLVGPFACVCLMMHLLLLVSCTRAAQVLIDNKTPRRDSTGVLMDVHDGNIVQWQPGGRYFWYG